MIERFYVQTDSNRRSIEESYDRCPCCMGLVIYQKGEYIDNTSAKLCNECVKRRKEYD